MKDYKDILIDIVENEIHVFYVKLVIPNMPVFVAEKTMEGLVRVKIMLEHIGYDSLIGTKAASDWKDTIVKKSN